MHYQLFLFFILFIRPCKFPVRLRSSISQRGCGLERIVPHFLVGPSTRGGEDSPDGAWLKKAICTRAFLKLSSC